MDLEEERPVAKQWRKKTTGMSVVVDPSGWMVKASLCKFSIAIGLSDNKNKMVEGIWSNLDACLIYYQMDEILWLAVDLTWLIVSLNIFHVYVGCLHFLFC